MVADRSKILADRIESTFPYRYFLGLLPMLLAIKKTALLELVMFFIVFVLSLKRLPLTTLTNCWVALRSTQPTVDNCIIKLGAKIALNPRIN